MGNQTVTALAANSSYVFAGATNNNGVYVSTNNGYTWVHTLLNNRSVYALAINGSNVFAGTVNYGVYLSTNNGQTWTQTSLNNQTIESLSHNGSNVFAGTNVGVYLSSNNGQNWTQTSLNNRIVYSLESRGSNVFAGTNNGTYISTNNGSTWIIKNQIIGNSSVYALALSNDFVFAGPVRNAVWRRPIAEIIGIKSISALIPDKFYLYQNYPNPFNLTTNIKFDLPKITLVKLKIYDLLGREHANLVNENLSAGTYSVDWNAVDYPSGVYFYRLETEDFTAVKRMVLIK
jgi:hypothetical protein